MLFLTIRIRTKKMIRKFNIKNNENMLDNIWNNDSNGLLIKKYILYYG